MYTCSGVMGFAKMEQDELMLDFTAFCRVLSEVRYLLVKQSNKQEKDEKLESYEYILCVLLFDV